MIRLTTSERAVYFRLKAEAEARIWAEMHRLFPRLGVLKPRKLPGRSTDFRKPESEKP